MTCRTLDDFYHIDASTFEKQYKDVLSGYRNWEELSHAEEWLVFPENIGPNLAIDETSLSNGDLYRLSLKPWGIALKFLFLHHENILFPND